MQRRIFIPGAAKLLRLNSQRAVNHSILVTQNANPMTLTNADWGTYNRAKFAISIWHRRTVNSYTAGGDEWLWAKGNGSPGTAEFEFGFDSSGHIKFNAYTSGSLAGQLITNLVFGTSAIFQHIMAHYDSANGTANSRMRIWVDGTEITSFSSRTNPSAAVDTVTGGDASVLGIGSLSPISSIVHKCAFFSGTLPAVTDLRSGAGVALEPVGQMGVHSVIKAQNGRVAYDSVKGLFWSGGTQLIDVNTKP